MNEVIVTILNGCFYCLSSGVNYRLGRFVWAGPDTSPPPPPSPPPSFEVIVGTLVLKDHPHFQVLSLVGMRYWSHLVVTPWTNASNQLLELSKIFIYAIPCDQFAARTFFLLNRWQSVVWLSPLLSILFQWLYSDLLSFWENYATGLSPISPSKFWDKTAPIACADVSV